MIGIDFRVRGFGTRLTLAERKALKTLQNNKELIIRNADKGGGVVLQTRKDYLTEANRILSDNDYYSTLTFNPITDYQKEYINLINEASNNNVITDKEKHFLVTRNPNTAIYYHLPKIHKDPLNPPGRPIISGINSLTSPLSKYIDIFLQKYVLTLDSYLKDSAALILLLKDTVWLPTLKWATLDVSALYSNIPHYLGIKAVGRILSKDKNIPTPQQEFIKKRDKVHLNPQLILHLILNYIYKTRGTTMGTRFAPSYANLFMG